MNILKTCWPLLLAVVTPTSLSAQNDSWSAQMATAPRQIPGVYSRFAIKLSYPQAIDPEKVPVLDVKNYSLWSRAQPDTKLELQTVKPGATSSVYLIPSSLINPQDDLSVRFTATVDGKTVDSGDIQVGKNPNVTQSSAYTPADPSYVRYVDFFGSRAHVTLDARSPMDGKKIPAIDYQLRFNLTSDTFGSNSIWSLRSDISSSGTVALDTSDTNITDYLFFSGNLTLLHTWELYNCVKDGPTLYWWGARLKPIEFETDQKFRIQNYTLKAQLACWVPYTDIPGVWLQRRFNIKEMLAPPLVAFLGYTFVHPTKEDSTVANPNNQESDRLEGEIAYSLPLSSRLRAGVRARGFILLNQGNEFRDYEELYVQYYLTDHERASVIFKYINGSLPPIFHRADTVNLGFSITF